ncbi:1-deoxy-D-xylulose-5-phosphate reductoisomerase [Clostridium rectalis]|uniref:1-deoxy-D-xylulose-5-phosphate reductoisomerase n=1 Tax=Clostridium rectalis TaxID=2040295 RepID=UPI000F644FA0|nr:1-deoxy-D-xylulose-5-phosphate reductoisomerase [Clostridium rectalis]
MKKNICILGATGSIGTQALDVLRKEKEDFSLIGISANNNWEAIINIIKEFEPKFAVLMNKNACDKVKDYCNDNDLNTEILQGMDGLIAISKLPEVDIVLTSVVGMIGLKPTLSAIKSGKDIALANKETLVVGGEIIKREALKNKVNIIPVDSEHGAIFQCLRGNNDKTVSKILLTASGGPFRGKNANELKNVTVKDALNHPKWSMGKKISIDSATLMNKGLEVIEAHFLFDVDYDNIQTVIHKESIIHSMVEYIDGSVIAQLATTDMKLPIQYALNYPMRKESVIDKLDFYSINKLTFEKPDIDTFKPLKLAYSAGKIGGTMPTVLNAANEAAVALFLKQHISFLKIGNILEECMIKFDVKYKYEIEDLIFLDDKVKKFVNDNYKL